MESNCESMIEQPFTHAYTMSHTEQCKIKSINTERKMTGRYYPIIKKCLPPSGIEPESSDICLLKIFTVRYAITITPQRDTLFFLQKQ
jgi:hypothetical protein